MSEDLRAWLIDQVKFYRRLGFFGEFRRISDSALAKRLDAMESQAGGAFDPSNAGAELSVLRWDQHRVWTEDPGLNVELGKQAYVQILQGLSRISRGCFVPTDLREEWESEEGPIVMVGRLDGSEFVSQALKDGNLMDLEVIKDINHVLIHPYYRFEIAEGDDGSASIVVLTSEEKAQIHRSRSLNFHVNELAGMFESCGLFGNASLKPASRLNFAGVFKDEYERALGKLTLTLEETRVMGRYQVQIEEIHQEINLTGYFDPGTCAISGTMLGLSRREGTMESYLGTWKGGLSRGAQAIFGTWVGWYSADARSADAQQHRNYSGTFGGLEEGIVRMGTSEPYSRKLAQWLRQVWDAEAVGDSPLTLI